MAEDGTPKELTLPHLEVPHFRTVFASGAIFTGPTDSSKNWQLTFYTEGAQVVSETLIAMETEGKFRHADPPKIVTQRIRRDEVCVIIPEAQLTSLLEKVAAAMKESDQ
jgi:hypothetical protein